MLGGQASQARSRDLHPRLTINRAALRHLALLLLLTPLMGGLRILIDHVDQRTVNEPIVVREVVEVPRTEYVQIEVPVPTVIIVEVPAEATPVTNQASLQDNSTTARPRASTAMAAPASASVAPEDRDAASVADGEATTGPRSDPTRAVAGVPARPYQPGPSVQAFEPQPVDKQPTSEPLTETPGQTAVVVAEAPAPAAPLSPAQHALADFYAYTDQNWSIQGYSSVDEMRDRLGNSTTGWLNETRRQAGSAIDPPGTVTEREVASRGESESKSEPESIALARPTATSVPAVDSFDAYTEQNWSALGYSSAEEMRRSLGVD